MKFSWILVIWLAVYAEKASLAKTNPYGGKRNPLEEIKNCDIYKEEKPVTFYVRHLMAEDHKQLYQVNEVSIQDYFEEIPPKCIVFTIHGLQGNRSVPVNHVHEVWNMDKCLFIVVEWVNAMISHIFDYKCTLIHIPYVGRTVAELIDSLVDSGRITLDKIYLIGFSLGAHVAGLTGRQIKSGRLPLIIGLDPAGPCMDSAIAPHYRINENDAKYVECIVTSPDGLGVNKNYCTATFVVNRGLCQPTCAQQDLCGVYDIFNEKGCNHYAAIDIYRRALKNNTYITKNCTGNDLLKAKCSPSYSSIRMSDPKNLYQNVTGVYLTPTDMNFNGMLYNENKEYDTDKELNDVIVNILSSLGEGLACP